MNISANDNTPVFDRGREQPAAFLDDIDLQDNDDSTTPAPAGKPRIATRGEWIGDTFFPNIELARLDKDEIAERRQKEKTRMHGEKERLAIRQGIGDPACPANDNEDFPLLAVLRRDGRDDYVRLVTRYRRLVALCASNPLPGIDYGHSSGGQPEYVTQRLKGDTAPEVAVDAAHAAGWPCDTVPGGELRYKAVRQVKPHGETPAARAVVATEETRVRTASLAVKFNDRVLLAQIDAKPILTELRLALGPLVDPFEDAVLGARTFTAIGKARGYEVKPDIAGKALVFEALDALDGVWHAIAVRQRRLARRAEQTALRARSRLAASQASYFGRAA
ncbi:hypothetical protein [Mesorhizobium mediterraneum]|uniref:hypothetical protein n=1 Tax=Mesorhizobium mediterraneum TaxID=43617 RepID=UPI001784C5DB|nr:hypothetical protein [Mesorhizobium mediterraneum]